MKNLVWLLVLTAMSANAEVVITGGFGTDGATGESIPVARSVKDAAQVYKALKIKPDSRDKKTIMLSDESQFECEKPYSGISRLNAGCQFALRASQKGKLTNRRGLSATLTFSGDLAEKLFLALPLGQQRVGATVKTVANVTCTKVVRPGVKATCTITDTNALDMDVDL
ncbi:MAG: hypothetical protein ACLGHN_00400 [Bacteriovoracia bacterium]